MYKCTVGLLYSIGAFEIKNIVNYVTSNVVIVYIYISQYSFMHFICILHLILYTLILFEIVHCHCTVYCTTTMYTYMYMYMY